MTNDDSAPNKPLPAVKGAHFSGLISEVGPGEWRAFAWVRKPDETPEQTIGPQTLITVPLAREWLSLAAASHGFDPVDPPRRGFFFILSLPDAGSIEQELNLTAEKAHYRKRTGLVGDQIVQCRMLK
jgi:hypothetical protein